MPEKRDFMNAFSRALAGDDGALDAWAAAGRRTRAGLAVYRNTVAKGRVDVLAAQFPTVEQLVGVEWFREAALLFAAAHPPGSPVMTEYGDDFPEWLATFEPASALPYLAPVARLDRAWSRALFAAADPPVSPGQAAGLSSGVLQAASARLHPSVGLFWFGWSAPTLWLAHRPDAGMECDLCWVQREEGLLLTRPAHRVLARKIQRSEWAFLDACRAGRTLAQAAAAAFAADPDLDLPSLFARLIGDGAFGRLVPAETAREAVAPPERRAGG